MIAYFKYTNGEAFTLDNEDYTGFFHINEGIAYSEKLSSSSSQQLTPKSNFISEFYLNLGNFNTIYTKVPELSSYYSNSFDLFNKETIDSSFGLLNDNNLQCFKSLIVGNPLIYKIQKNDCFYYGMSSETDTIIGKDYDKNMIEFSKTEDWEFLDNVQGGSFVVNSNHDFKYICTTGTDVYILSGNFLNKNLPLTLIDHIDQHPLTVPPLSNLEYTYKIYHDVYDKKMFFVNKDTINIYDVSNYDECSNLILIDKISLSEATTEFFIWNYTDIAWNNADFKYPTKFRINSVNDSDLVKIGANIRTTYGDNTLYIFNKYSSYVVNSIDLSDYDIDSPLSVGVRNVDDYIAFLYKNSDQDHKILFIDPITSDVISSDIRSLSSSSRYDIHFSDIDSDVFYISTEKEYQSRFISASDYPSGRLSFADLYYPTKYKWNTTDIDFNEMFYPWNYLDYRSNSFNNILTSEVIKNNKMYSIVHNIGRIYALNQPPLDRFYNIIGLNVEKNYTGVSCSNSSFGFYLNSAISDIIKDLLLLNSSSAGGFEISEYKIDQKIVEDVIPSVYDLYINGNETFNSITIQRIFLLINELQTKLLAESG